MGRNNKFEMPLTQEDLGDALGLSPVHINRVLRRLRERGLMTVSNRKVVVQDLEALKRVGGFNPLYFHLK